MVLVDTSVWIRFLYGREPYSSGLLRLFDADEAAGHEMVYGELLIGDISARTKLLADYRDLPQAPMVPHEEVANFVRHRRLHGRGLGWIDAHLLASALVGKSQLWTADSALAHAAQELGVAHRP